MSSKVIDLVVNGKRRAGLTIKHGTHVRRDPGWKGAPDMTCGQNFEYIGHILFFEMSL